MVCRLQNTVLITISVFNFPVFGSIKTKMGQIKSVMDVYVFMLLLHI